MDRLKNIHKGGLNPAYQPKPSYAGASDSRSPSASKASGSSGSLGKIKGLIPDKVSGLVNRGSSSPTSEERTARPATALTNPSTFAPPPKHRVAYGDEAAAASVLPPPSYTSSSGLNAPSVPPRRTTEVEDGGSRNPPRIPPRLPPRTGSATSTDSIPTPRAVTQEDLRQRGGISAGAVGALGRLGKAGVAIPGFEVQSASQSPQPPPRADSRPLVQPTGDRPANSEAPMNGTSFAEKRAAIQTTNHFYKDPSRTSLADVKAAANTARNFQQRHGDQVASGTQALNKYGFVANATPALPTSALSSIPSHSSSPPLPARTGSIPPPLPNKKKPPPLPAKKKPPTVSEQANPPPPIPLASRPPAVPDSTRPPATPQATYTSNPAPSSTSASLPNSGLPPDLCRANGLPTDLDLALHTNWFTASPIRFPPAIQNNPSKSFRYSTSWARTASGHTKHTLTLAFLWTHNLSSTKIRVTWDQAAPEHTVAAQQRHFPPPTALTSSQLEQMASRGPEIVAWCETRMGQQVGDGECWTLAFQALKDTPGVMESQQTTHGACIFSHYPPSPPVFTEDVDIMPGDILQFWSAKWDLPNGGWKRAGMPDHTSVVIGARREMSGGWTLQVLEQNVGGVKQVMRGECEIGEGMGMGEGGVRVFRPVWEGWGEVDLEWE